MNKYYKLSIGIFLIFLGICLSSYLAEQVPGMLGDWTCSGTGNKIKDSEGYTIHYERCNYLTGLHGFHYPMKHFGFRHYAFIMFGLVITIISIIRLSEQFNKEVKK